MPAKRIFRRTFLIKKGLQFRYIGVIFALVLLASIVSGYTVFITGWSLLGEKLANVYPQGRLIQVFRMANVALVRNLLLVSPLIFVLSLLFSHKIAGPLYRIEKSVHDISKGNLALKIKLREGDELWTLADIINNMTENLNKSMASSKESIAKIQKDVDAIKKAIFSQPYDPRSAESSVASLQQQVKNASDSLDKWTTSSAGLREGVTPK